MSTVDAETRARTLARFHEHRRAWEANAALRTLYAEWYGRLVEELPSEALGPRVELGSGPGFARAFIPGVVLSDLVKAPWHDHEIAADALPFEDDSVGALVMFDVLHHVAAPRRFFAEAGRVLRAGGRVVMCEPYVSPLSYAVYKLAHDEPVDLGADPLADASAAPGRDPFDSNQALPTLLFGRHRRKFEAAFPSLRIHRIERLAALSYATSGGFSRRPLLPHGLWTALHRLESRLPRALFRLIGFRMIVVLERHL